MKRIILIAGLLVLLLMTGCDVIPAETTLPVETTAPAETTLPPETMPPSETTVLSEQTDLLYRCHEAMAEDGFAIMDECSVSGYTHYYCYTGESDTIEIALLDMTLTLPEGWREQVLVIQEGVPQNDGTFMDNSVQLYVSNRAITDALREETASDFGWRDFVFQITPISKNGIFSEDPRTMDSYVGENEDYYFFVRTPATEDVNCSEQVSWRSDLIGRIGEDAYNELVGDLIVTPEMVREMVTIQAPEA